MKKTTTILIVALCLIFSINCYSQKGGKIFAKEEANKLFGKVEQSVDMKASALLKLIEKTEKRVMFRFVKSKLLIAGDKRKMLKPSNAKIKDKDVFMYFSKEKVVELLNRNKVSTVKIEKRAEKITLTYGTDTLEECTPCPPDCEL